MTTNKSIKPAPDLYYKKTITFRYCRRELQFRVSQDLFSSFQIDVGTQFLLRTVTPDCASPYKKVLDLGCGYGTLVLTLKILNPDCEVHAVDRDALAVEFCRQNAALNGLKDIQVYGSLDYDSVTARDFDLVISNIPGKAGEPVIRHMLLDTEHFLRPHGVAAVVVVSPLQEMVTGILKNEPLVIIKETINRSGHTVFHYGFDGPAQPKPTTEHEVYFRGMKDFSFGGLDYRMETAYGLPEFDQLSYHTALMVDALKNLTTFREVRTLVLNPGIGHLAVALWKLLSPRSILLADRDLLALRYTEKNLVLNGCPKESINLWHGVGAPEITREPFNVTAAVLREEEGPEAVAHTVRLLAELTAPEGKILLGASSTAITRVAEKLPSIAHLRILGRSKFRGFSALLLERQFPGKRPGVERSRAVNPPIDNRSA